MTTFTRRYRFSASHRLHSPELSRQENEQLYGKCNNPYGHGHDYILSITVAGEVDRATGLLISVPKLDGFVETHVLHLFRSRNINLDVPQFATLIPTTENIALVIKELLEQSWAQYFGHGSPRLHRIHIQETDRNGFEIVLSQPKRSLPPHHEMESVPVHA